MSQEVIFEHSEVCHRSVYQRRERCFSAAVFGNHNIASPSLFFLEAASLKDANRSVDREGHAIASYDRIKNDVRVRKFSIHAVKCFHKLGENCEHFRSCSANFSLPGVSSNELQYLRPPDNEQVRKCSPKTVK